MAIPFFIFAGDLMVRGGIAARIVAFAGSLIGHVRGGLGQVNIAASTLFGGISGSAVAEAAAVGGIMIPQMKARGYGADYAVNVTSMAALIALLLPPSHNMIIYSISGGGRISIADLFTAGIIPGLLLALALVGHRLHRRPPPRLPDRALPGLRPRRPAVPDLAPRPAAHRHHLRRRALRRLHRHRELLRRGALRAPRHRCSSTATSAGREFVARHPGGGAHHLDGAADHRHGRRLRLADGLPAGRADDRRPDGRDQPEPAAPSS